jgi:cytochrome c peroxidase
MLLVLSIFFSLTAFSSQDLDSYIERFRMKSLEMPPKNEALFQLGYKLFHDKNLSGKGNISCQSCHSLEGFSGDALPLGLGEGATGLGNQRTQRDGLVLNRHTQNIYNVGHPTLRNHFWDGRVSYTRDGWISPEEKFNGPNPELKDVARTFQSVSALMSIFPFTSPEEMLGKESKLTRLEAWDFVLSRIFEGPSRTEYKKLFKNAFGEKDSYNIAHVGNALAELMRHQYKATETPWDNYLRGNKKALSPKMKRGAVLFFSKAGCITCHNGEHLTNFTYHNIGVPQIGQDDQGRDNYRFRVPPLRNVGVTAPYMHSGVFKSLSEVIDHYDDPIASLRNFKWNPYLANYNGPIRLDTDLVTNDNRERLLSRGLPRKLGLSLTEKDDLNCFLTVALTDKSLQGVLNEIPDCSVLSFRR